MQVGAQQQVAAVEGLAEGWLGRVELPAHAHVLRALSREEERDLRRVGFRGPALDQALGLLTGDEGGQLFAQALERRGDHRDPVAEVRPSHSRGEREV